MFLALRELRFARSRFALMGAVVALIAVLMVLVSRLPSGLVNDGVSGLQPRERRPRWRSRHARAPHSTSEPGTPPPAPPVGAFFTVWTIYRRHKLAVLRAIGASRAYLLRDGLGVGAVVAGGDVPFALETPAVPTAAGLLITLGLLGSATAILRIATVNPLAALGAQR